MLIKNRAEECVKKADHCLMIPGYNPQGDNGVLGMLKQIMEEKEDEGKETW